MFGFLTTGARRGSPVPPVLTAEDTNQDSGGAFEHLTAADISVDHPPEPHALRSALPQAPAAPDHHEGVVAVVTSQNDDGSLDDRLGNPAFATNIPPAAGQINAGGEDSSCATDAVQDDIADAMAVVAIPDPKIEALRLKASALEGEIVDLSARQAEMEQLIREFEYCQYQALGDVLAECLRLRHEYLRLKASRSGKEEDRNAEQEAAAEYDAYQSVQEDAAQSIPSLGEDERDELKKLYRAAVMHCHPDRVADEDKAAAHDFFLQTQQAYRRSDLESLRRIHRQLTEERSFGGQALAVTGKDKLQQIVSDLQIQAADLILAIQTMQLSDRYCTAARTDDWDDYFARARQLWEAECDVLRQQISVFSAA